jgi:hypothetical protein
LFDILSFDISDFGKKSQHRTAHTLAKLQVTDRF